MKSYELIYKSFDHFIKRNIVYVHCWMELHWNCTHVLKENVFPWHLRLGQSEQGISLISKRPIMPLCSMQQSQWSLKLDPRNCIATEAQFFAQSNISYQKCINVQKFVSVVNCTLTCYISPCSLWITLQHMSLAPSHSNPVKLA